MGKPYSGTLAELQVRAPTLKKRQIVFLDNVSTHKVEAFDVALRLLARAAVREWHRGETISVSVAQSDA
jgi:hypothetical protein